MNEMKKGEKIMKKHELVQKVTKDYKDYLLKMENTDYCLIRTLIERLEKWNEYGANLDYSLNIIDDYLYINNIKISNMENILGVNDIKNDSIQISLNDGKLVCIAVQWFDGSDAFISQIYVYESIFDDDYVILYENEKTSHKINYMTVEAMLGEETLNSEKIYSIADAYYKTYYDEVFNMTSTDKLKVYSRLNEFIMFMIEKTENDICEGFDNLMITLIDGTDEKFLWSIKVDEANHNTRYEVIDWKKKGLVFKYDEEREK